MALTPGSRIGVFQLVELIGRGGMGEVYKATDTNLKRSVAIKVLPASVAGDAERLARFQREAEVLAALNHPNIAAIYGLEKSDGITALVMELVEGPTLADRIAQGAIPIDEALPIAKQIAEALEAAHEQGIVHRDLKPANIKVRPDGTVKVLDFGLAKAMEPAAGSSPSMSMSPTITTPAMTQAGMILGTAAYMSPEQARGKTVDKRADIWAFGAVLYEMLTGTRAFEGEDIADTLGNVMKVEPNWQKTPTSTPPRVVRVMRACLQKNPKQRIDSAQDVRLALEGVFETAAPTASTVAPVVSRTWAGVAWSAALGIVSLAALGWGASTYFQPAPADTPVYRTTILPPDKAALGGTNSPVDRFALSPDGRRLAFVARGEDRRVQLWVRPLDSMTAQPLAGTDGAASPFWSPDSRFIAFYAQGKLRKIDAAGGPALTLTDALTVGGGSGGGTWNRDDVILFSPRGVAGLFRVSAAGGMSSPVTMLDAASGERGHLYPTFLPDGRHFIYVSRGTATSPTAVGGVYVGALDSMERKQILTGVGNATYARGALLFLRDTTLMAQRFDVERLELAGDSVPLAESVDIGGLTGAVGAFAASETGILAYQTRGDDLRSQLTWFDRTGKQLATVGEPADQLFPALSPNGTRLAVSVLDPAANARDIWIYELARDNLRTRFTFDPSDELDPTWSPDGSRIVFNSARKGTLDVYQKASTGAGPEEVILADSGNNKYPRSWSPDGRFLLFHIGNSNSQTGNDLWILPLVGDRKPTPVLQVPFNQTEERFSPDGRWIAYQSNESGRSEVYVTSFAGATSAAAGATDSAGGKWQVSSTGGSGPHWRRDGKELFYLSADNMLMAATVNGQGSAFEVGAVRALFEVRIRTEGYLGYGTGTNYDVSPDGQRFLVNAAVTGQTTTPITVVVNWPTVLGARARR